jgi:hypothetical protein
VVSCVLPPCLPLGSWLSQLTDGVPSAGTHAQTAHAGDPETDPEAGHRPSRSNRTKDGGPVSRPFPSWNRSILTEISLCHACSCEEMLRTETAGQVINGGLDLHVGGADFGTSGQLDLPVWNASGQYSSDLFARKAAEWVLEHGRDRPTVPMFLYHLLSMATEILD